MQFPTCIILTCNHFFSLHMFSFYLNIHFITFACLITNLKKCLHLRVLNKYMHYVLDLLCVTKVMLAALHEVPSKSEAILAFLVFIPLTHYQRSGSLIFLYLHYGVYSINLLQISDL